jgi:hypothetical protein
MLSNIREGKDLKQTLEIFNKQYDMWASMRKDSKTVKLTPTNALADEINNTELAAIDSPEFTYVGEVADNFDQKRFPAPLNLKLKVGARIMFIKNDAEKKYVNGSMGTITSLAEDKIEAMIDGWDDPIQVKKETWESIKYIWGGKKKKEAQPLGPLPSSPLKNEQVSDDVLEELDKGEISHEVTGQYKQYPITPAWAVTIHKSQSKTFDAVNVMINGNIFADGQLYVALSRCRTLQGIMISRPINLNDILVNKDVVKFYDSIRKQREVLAMPTLCNE